MKKTYISSLLVVLLAGAQSIRAQGNLDDVFAQLDAAEGGAQPAAAPATVKPASAPATMQSAQPAQVEVSGAPAAASMDSGDLLDRGVAYYQDGEYDKAQAVFEAVLAQDPYNRKAMDYIRRTAHKISASELHKQDSSRAQAFAEVDGAWNPEPKSYVAGTDLAPVKAVDPQAAQIAAMTERLKGIVIPSLDFRDANIKDVVLFLTETCRRQDPTGKGVNILLLGMDDGMGGQNNITISIVNMSLYDALQYIVEMASLKFEVKPGVVAVMPVNYVPDSALVLKSYDVIPEVGEELASMAGDSGGGGVDDLFGGSSSSASASGPTDVKNFFSIVDWPEGSSAIYQPNFHKLFVKNTPKNLVSVENVLADLEDEAIKKRSQQVSIEAKFVEYNEGALDELGFDWTLYDNGEFAGFGLSQGTYYRRGQGYGTTTVVDGGTTAAGPYLYTDPLTGYKKITPQNGVGQNLFGNAQRNNTTAFDQSVSGILGFMGGAPAVMSFSNKGHFPIDLAISALEQEGTADVLSAPRVTTKSGNEAVIKVVEIHRYPQDYDVETGQRTAPVVKPQDWEDYDLGVVLKVTPVVDAEANTIDLDLQPEIRKFKGYDPYIVGYNAYETGGENSPVQQGDGSALIALMPYFEVRSVQTQVTIADGNTVMMGGLVDERTETFRDQVPFLGDIPYLGRLFRTEGTRSQKKNLTIFVKATQVDDRGMTREDRDLARQAQQASN